MFPSAFISALGFDIMYMPAPTTVLAISADPATSPIIAGIDKVVASVSVVATIAATTKPTTMPFTIAFFISCFFLLARGVVLCLRLQQDPLAFYHPSLFNKGFAPLYSRTFTTST
ncbi:hypothetical protein [Wolbachia endosymbiont of Mansonella perstans]|uniref:hypothetical protein n=1 Tax=Wolbachia endosymbiont of Mansonella perstans TaxID=229526 RepID=UPI001CE0DB7F|nr:hypothetical protein [Wolbachia endosymbiont of Mansonella perstans]MCA4774256.1 hypothetical protein [Wolbachia endosymbiont of Mansonella perstans]